MSSAGIQKLFCGIYSTFKCSFDEFVGEKVFSPSYSSAILAPPPKQLNFRNLLLNYIELLFQVFHLQICSSSLWLLSFTSYLFSIFPICSLFPLFAFFGYIIFYNFPFNSIQFSCSVMSDSLRPHELQHSTPGLPVHHQLPESTQTHVHWVGDAIQNFSSSVIPFSSCPQSFPASGSFQMSQLFTSGDQSTGVSASTWILPRTPRTDL